MRMEWQVRECFNCNLGNNLKEDSEERFLYYCGANLLQITLLPLMTKGDLFFNYSQTCTFPTGLPPSPPQTQVTRDTVVWASSECSILSKILN